MSQQEAKKKNDAAIKGAGFSRLSGIWECPKCHHWNAYSTTRLNNPKSNRIALDCKNCNDRISIWYKSLFGFNHWLVKHEETNFRGDAIRLAELKNLRIGEEE